MNNLSQLPFTKIVLGSGSPRRKQLLEGLGWPVTVVKKEVDESLPPGAKRGSIAMQLAEKKAMAFDGDLPADFLLITADTIVCLGEEVLGKPIDREDAIRMLEKLQGQTHQVYTGVCLTLGRIRHCFSTETHVRFFSLSEEMIASYIDHYQPYDKAGSYGAQEGLPPGINPLSEKEKLFLSQIKNPTLFEDSLAVDPAKQVPIIAQIDGSYFNVMGLPVVELWQELQHLVKQAQ
jgi:septum formation protein